MQPTAEEFRRRFKAIAGQFTSTAQLDLLLQKMAPTPVRAGTEIVQYEGPSSTLFLLWDGALSVSIGKGSESVTLGAIGPGEWIGEITLIEPGPASATVTTKEDSTLLALPHETFRQLEQSEPNIASALLHAISLSLAERLRATSSQVSRCVSGESLASKTLKPPERASIARLIADLMGIQRRH